jgi:UDP-N-acetyl-D-glucosamine/UDP-N-acetyl-D-galactosamine dehydrogenase
MYSELINKEAKLALIGLGYVGLPIALEFAKKISVIGFDINESRLNKMRNKIDPGQELEANDFDGCDIEFTSSLEKLKEASFFIVAVPTPIDTYNTPDLKPLLSATATVAKCLKKGDCVVYESTVYPGCTEEDCLPILEDISGLKAGVDFKYGYSPERINPGDKQHTLINTVKIVSGCDEEALETISKVYEIVVENTYKAPSIKVAEAAKIIENTQRDVNIALMNELSILFSRMNINVFDVIDAAGTKWNFLKYYPGLVGGHCIGVDPYYLVYKAHKLGYHPQMINSGRFVNDSMGGYIAKRVAKSLISQGAEIVGAKFLIMGVTFKENVSDIRNSKVVDIVKELRQYGIESDIIDPHADPEEVEREYKLKIIDAPQGKYDGIVIAVLHEEYLALPKSYFDNLLKDISVVFDVKGHYRKDFANSNTFKYNCL